MGSTLDGQRRVGVAQIGAIAVALALAAFQSVFALNLLLEIIKVHGGLVGVLALAGVPALGIAVIVVSRFRPTMHRVRAGAVCGRASAGCPRCKRSCFPLFT